MCTRTLAYSVGKERFGILPYNNRKNGMYRIHPRAMVAFVTTIHSIMIVIASSPGVTESGQMFVHNL